MTIPLRFTKMTAAGNDFLCIHNAAGQLDALLESPQLAQWAAGLCRRRLGVGADGVIVASRLDTHPLADLRARFFEPDGSEVELCGNGTACLTQWALDKALVTGKEVKILTQAGLARGKKNGDEPGRVRACIPQPRELVRDVEVDAAGRRWRLDTVITGVPHGVIYVDDLEAVDVLRAGAAIRRHPRFQPRGINVNFVQVLGVGRLAIRTFEFGVEDETLACGTGSASAAILATLRFGWPEVYLRGGEPVLVEVRGGETVKIWFVTRDGLEINDVCLETRVVAVYEGELRPEFAAKIGATASRGTINVQ